MPEAADRYLQGGAHYFWCWEEGGDVLSLRDGATIAYRDYVQEVLDFLAPQGLPPFGAVLLALAATNPQGSEHVAHTFRLVEAQLHATHGHRVLLPPVRAFLERLAVLPRQYREGRNRLLLLQAIFGQVHNALSVSNARAVAQGFTTAALAEAERAPDAGFPRAVFYKDFRAIGLLDRRFPDEPSILDALTALPQVPVEIQPEPGPEGPSKDLLDELLEEPRTFAVAALVKRLWSGLQIPHHYSLPSQQPIGGVSDLTNKGPFDRLLITEFAYDDDQFALRVANNEALYINREVPPEHNDRERILLIDTSIRSWGTPKVLAYALLLAIARHPKTDIPCRAFAIGKGYGAIAFDSVAGLIDALQVLSPCADAAEGLAAFFRSGELHRNSEVFFICARDAAAQPGVHKVIQEHYTSFQYWLHTDADGSVDLYRRQHNARKLLQQLRLPLKELWAAQRPPAQQEARPQRLPAADAAFARYPVLFSKPLRYRHLFALDKAEHIVITRSGSVLVDTGDARPERQSKGMYLMLEGIPPQLRPLAAGRTTRGEHLLLTYERKQKLIVLFHLDNGEQRSAPITEADFSRVRGVIFEKDRFYMAGGAHGQTVFSIGWGEPVCKKLEQVTHHLQPRFHRPYELAERTAQAKAAVQAATASYYHAGNLLTRPKRVWISTEGALQLNDLELKMTGLFGRSQQWVGLEPNYRAEHAVSAEWSGNQEFRFPDGSTVRIHPDGMAVLQSAEPSLPAIYFTTILHVTTALATEEVWTGDAGFAAPHLRYIDPPTFFKHYIAKFIHRILTHGTTDQTR
ncbi:hypothetical protein [Flaviaesturariibacter amylovorans]|uniref:Uncharacterized protein n=1 Tax=Flaviaesturariibacter amylovorans TaxID=1084520 RepID=A0ABP8HKJ7_9BACT